MTFHKKVIGAGLSISIFLGGCGMSDDSGSKEKKEEKEFVSVQEYTGEGFKLRNGSEVSDQIAEDNREEVESAVKKFFKEKYKTEVKVHNIVGARGYATVFVESINSPHFYTYANIPVDENEKKVDVSGVWSMEGEVEGAIQSALYGIIFEDEFAKLDQYFEEITEKYKVVGMRKEALENVGARGYSTPYYFVSTTGEEFDQLYDIYLKNPKISDEEIKQILNKKSFEVSASTVAIKLFMAEKDKKPDKSILDKVAADISKIPGLPRGSYGIVLNDNDINAFYGMGTKQDSLKIGHLEYIVKE